MALLCCLFKNIIFSPPPPIEGDKARITGTVSRLEKRKTGITLVVDNVLIYASSEEKLYPGSKIQAAGNLKTFSKPENPGQFNEFSYYKSKNIDYIMFAEELTLLEETKRWDQAALYRLKERLWQVYVQILPEKEAGTLAAMLLGEKQGLLEEVKEIYQKAGLGHLLAISGLHVSLVAMGVYQGILALRGSKGLAAAGGMGALILYGALTGFHISTSRAVIMLFLALAAQLLGRSYDRETALAFSSLWILSKEPGQLFQCGFLLSFGAALGAGTLYPVLCGILFLEKKPSWMKSALLFQLSVQLVTMPVILWFYYEIPVYGVVLNLFLVPLMGLVAGGGLLAGFAGLFSLEAGRFLAGGVWLLLGLYEKMGELSLLLPFALWNPGRPSFGKILFYGAGLVLVLVGLRKKGRKKAGLAAGTAFLLVVFLLLPGRVKGLELTFLDVGQGDGAFLRCEEGISCLFDGGSSSIKQVGSLRILPFLKCKGEKKPDYIFVSHMDEDHVSGIRELVDRRAGRCLVLSADLKKEEKAQALASQAEARGMDIWWIEAGDKLIAGNLEICCLAPEGIYDGTNENAASMVLSVRYGEIQGLMTGDVEKEGEEALMEKKLPLCDFLKVAHHGSDYSTTEEFLKRTLPKTAVISCGRDNSYGHPGKKLMKRLEESGCQIYMTCERGAVTVFVQKNRLKIEKKS